MPPRSTTVTFGFGLRDRVDPKFAPFGVLKVGKNLRVRKDGRLGVRRGFWPLVRETVNGQLYANDLHEYRGRLLALGSDADDAYPTDLFEYTGTPAASPWRGCDPTGTRVVLNPFTNLREVAGTPLPGDGITSFDAAIGGGLICYVYNVGQNLFDAYAMVVDAATDQVIHFQQLNTFSLSRARVVYSGGTFYVAGLNGPANIYVYSFTPGTSTAFSVFLIDSSPNGVTAFDMCAVSNATTGRVAVGIDRNALDLTVKVYNASAVQVGTTCTVTGTSTIHLAMDADQADNTINLYTVETATTGRLRTFNFSGTLLDGPTATTSGPLGGICRLPAASGFNEHVAVCVNDGSSNVVVQFFDVDAHTVSDSVTIQQAILTTKPISGQSANQNMAVAFGALVGTDLTALTGLTNALFFATPDGAHMSTRDLLTAVRQNVVSTVTMSRDEDTGIVCWPARRDSGAGTCPAISTVDFQSNDRRQSAPFGGLLYFAGATPAVYDGRFPVPLNFGETPGIVSLTPSTSSGSLASSATYTYVVHWEYVLADGSVVVGPVSSPLQAATGSGDHRITAVVTTPHTLAIALGDALYGANVVAVLSRTTWENTARIEQSTFRRGNVEPVSVGMANYGEPLSITDQVSDTALADEAAVYTQGSRGPVSAPLQHFAPLACSYLTATEARLLTGGLARSADVQVSKAAFIGEAFEFNPLSQYFSTVSGPVRGVRNIDGAKLVFTSDRIYVIAGDGPNDIGEGALDYPREIPTPSGLSNPWSFLDAPDGLWFQLDDTKLFRIPRGGGAPTWEGIDVQDTLLEYPEIVGAAKCQTDNVAVFACNRSGGGARLIVRDFRTEQWFVDEVQLDGATRIDSITTWGSTIAYSASGKVFYQEHPLGLWDVDSPSSGSTLFIETQARTHPLYPFGLGGYGQIYECLLTVEWLSACVIECRVSYDDGVNFTTLASFDLSTGTPGQTIQRKWTLPQDITSSVVFEFTVTQSGSSLGEGVAFNGFDLLFEAEAGLRELSADEMA